MTVENLVGIIQLLLDIVKIEMWYVILLKSINSTITLQEMCCGFLLSREMWYRKSVLPGSGAG